MAPAPSIASTTRGDQSKNQAKPKRATFQHGASTITESRRVNPVVLADAGEKFLRSGSLG